MRLSEAIRLGAMLHPQGFYETVDSSGRRCALGSALAAIGSPETVYTATFGLFPITSCHAIHPVSGATDYCLLSVVRELNDNYGWTRERIADWVETVESAEADEAERQQALTVSTDLPRGTTDDREPVTAQRA